MWLCQSQWILQHIGPAHSRSLSHSHPWLWYWYVAPVAINGNWDGNKTISIRFDWQSNNFDFIHSSSLFCKINKQIEKHNKKKETEENKMKISWKKAKNWKPKNGKINTSKNEIFAADGSCYCNNFERCRAIDIEIDLSLELW